MNSRQFADALAEIVWDRDVVDERGEPLGRITRSQTYADAQMLTMNDGLTVVLDNGDEFQLTIVQSRVGDLDPCPDCHDEGYVLVEPAADPEHGPEPPAMEPCHCEAGRAWADDQAHDGRGFGDRCAICGREEAAHDDAVCRAEYEG